MLDATNSIIFLIALDPIPLAVGAMLASMHAVCLIVEEELKSSILDSMTKDSQVSGICIKIVHDIDPWKLFFPSPAFYYVTEFQHVKQYSRNSSVSHTLLSPLHHPVVQRWRTAGYQWQHHGHDCHGY